VKLIIQIPCLNEAEHLPATLATLPRSMPGFDTVEWLVIDDGSTDETRQVAAACGVDHVIGFSANRGLAAAFSYGIEEALRRGADVIVNTDADNQYDASCIPDLVAPILAGQADIVVGDRQTGRVAEFSPIKRVLQRAGTSVVRSISGLSVGDATSGFRAYSRAAAMSLVITTPYTYTLESLVQAGNSRLALVNVPVARNDSVRPSRLFGSMWGYVRRNTLALFRVLSYYTPLKFFWSMAAVLLVGALVAWMPFTLDLIREGRADGHMQSIILGAVLAISGVQMFALGVIADQVSSLRAIGIRTLRETRELHYGTLYSSDGVPVPLPGAWDASGPLGSGQAGPGEAPVAPQEAVLPPREAPVPPQETPAAPRENPAPGRPTPVPPRDGAPTLGHRSTADAPDESRLTT
jgi:glycosyltransferase involved in cell wall biosynthesis